MRKRKGMKCVRHDDYDDRKEKFTHVLEVFNVEKKRLTTVKNVFVIENVIINCVS